MLSNYPDALTCDMAETYGVFDIHRLPARLAATLAVGLGADSRVKMAKEGRLVGNDVMLMAVMVDTLRGVAPSDPQSMTSCCYKSKVVETAPSNAKHEVFDSPEAFKARWAEITRN